MKKLNFFFSSTMVLFISLLLIDYYSTFEIKAQWLKTTAHLIILIIPIIVIVINLRLTKEISEKIFISIFPATFIIIILISNPLSYLVSSPVYQTQHIYYINKNNPSKKVEYQMQDIGAFGYNKRNVEVIHYFGLFMKVKLIEQIKYNEKDWLKVDLNVNQLDLQLP